MDLDARLESSINDVVESPLMENSAPLPPESPPIPALLHHHLLFHLHCLLPPQPPPPPPMLHLQPLPPLVSSGLPQVGNLQPPLPPQVHSRQWLLNYFYILHRWLLLLIIVYQPVHIWFGSIATPHNKCLLFLLLHLDHSTLLGTVQCMGYLKQASPISSFSKARNFFLLRQHSYRQARAFPPVTVPQPSSGHFSCNLPIQLQIPHSPLPAPSSHPYSAFYSEGLRRIGDE